MPILAASLLLGPLGLPADRRRRRSARPRRRWSTDVKRSASRARPFTRADRSAAVTLPRDGGAGRHHLDAVDDQRRDAARRARSPRRCSCPRPAAVRSSIDRVVPDGTVTSRKTGSGGGGGGRGRCRRGRRLRAARGWRRPAPTMRVPETLAQRRSRRPASSPEPRPARQRRQASPGRWPPEPPTMLAAASRAPSSQPAARRCRPSGVEPYQFPPPGFRTSARIRPISAASSGNRPAAGNRPNSSTHCGSFGEDRREDRRRFGLAADRGQRGRVPERQFQHLRRQPARFAVLGQRLLHFLLRHQLVAAVGVRVGALVADQPLQLRDRRGVILDPQIEQPIGARPMAGRCPSP